MRVGIVAAVSVLAALFSVACSSSDADPSEPGGSSPENRKHIGKADSLSGSCSAVEYCGGKSEGQCYCDDQCAAFGDCCHDYKDVCESAPNGCNADNPCSGGYRCVEPQCFWGGPCPEGTCVLEEGRCESAANCEGDKICVTPACDPSGPCPAGFCSTPPGNPNTKSCNHPTECDDGYSCVMPQCLPGGPCPDGTCVLDAGRCETKDDCEGDKICVTPACNPAGPCPVGFCSTPPGNP